jgi:lipopolysaccharide/colanic/teichoic acid biosynthesis glycosyltransferase
MRIEAQRLFDIAGAAGGILFFSPVMAAVAVAIRLDDGGPIVFRQERLGERRVPFTILKFRSMRDGETTRVGRLLRGTGLDELPQLVNVLRGDMSAVGPRPLQAADVARWGWNTPRHDFRWQVRPGLTGLGQLRGTGSPRRTLVLESRVYRPQEFVPRSPPDRAVVRGQPAGETARAGTVARIPQTAGGAPHILSQSCACPAASLSRFVRRCC